MALDILRHQLITCLKLNLRVFIKLRRPCTRTQENLEMTSLLHIIVLFSCLIYHTANITISVVHVIVNMDNWISAYVNTKVM